MQEAKLGQYLTGNNFDILISFQPKYFHARLLSLAIKDCIDLLIMPVFRYLLRESVGQILDMIFVLTAWK